MRISCIDRGQGRGGLRLHVEEHDAARSHPVEDARGDGPGSRVGPVARVDVPEEAVGVAPESGRPQDVGVEVAVAVAVRVGVTVRVEVTVAVAVTVGVLVTVGVAVIVAVFVAVGVFEGTKVGASPDGAIGEFR